MTASDDVTSDELGDALIAWRALLTDNDDLWRCDVTVDTTRTSLRYQPQEDNHSGEWSEGLINDYMLRTAAEYTVSGDYTFVYVYPSGLYTE
jgi:hypothetical protein